MPPAQAPPVASAPFLFGRPAPSEAGSPDISNERAVLLGKVLGNNPTLQRRAAFDHVGGDPRFWLPSTEWMLRFQEGGPTLEDAVEGATEAEDLKVLELTGGRTTRQLVTDGLASRNTILWWREGLPGNHLTFELEAPEAGPYEIVAAFLHDREMGTVQPLLNDEPFGDPMDFYRPDLTAPGPVSLGVHSFEQGPNQLTFRMVGANPDAERNYIFGLDYIKLEPGETAGSLFTKDDLGIDVIDPITEAKDSLIRMFTSWFAADSPEEVRKEAIALANKTALRRHPEVLKALAAWIEHEPSPVYRTRIENILNSDDKVYGAKLRELIQQESEGQRSGEVRPLEASDEWIADIIRFRDYVFTEMTRIDPKDNRACISCHGVPGRVPTLYLEPPDAAGYIPPEGLLGNYRRMQQRVDLHDVEKSKFLRKPLNIQSGEEDGHQGGVRYKPDDRGLPDHPRVGPRPGQAAGALTCEAIRQAVSMPAAFDRPSSSTSRARITNFCTFPVTVMGNSSTKRRCAGTLKCAIRPAQNSRTASSVRLAPSRNLIQAGDALAEPLVGKPEYVHVGNVRMRVQVLLDLARVDVLPAPDDHLLRPARDAEAPIVTHGRQVARAEPSVPVDGQRGVLGILVVPFHDQVAARQQLAPPPGLHRISGVRVDDLDLGARQCTADSRSAHLDRVVAGRLRDRRRGLCQPVRDGHPVAVHLADDALHQLHGARRAGHDPGPEAGRVEVRELRVVQFRDEHRRHAVHHAAALLVNGPQGGQRVELGGRQHQRRAEHQDFQGTQDAAEAVVQGNGQAQLVRRTRLQRPAHQVGVVD